MKSAGYFNVHEYMKKLYEAAEEGETPKNSVGDGLIIPAENKKSYDWLKKEYKKGQTEVKVEMKMGGSNFKPGYDLQGASKSVDKFEPGMFGQSGKEKSVDPPKNDADNKTSKKSPDIKEDGENKPKKTAGVQIKGAVTSPVKKKKDKE